MQWIVLLLKYEVFNILCFAGFLKKYRFIEIHAKWLNFRYVDELNRFAEQNIRLDL